MSLYDGAARGSIRGDLGNDLFVEAGAGTGKTSELTARVVALIASGRCLASQLAVITFTEAAASEVRERIREGLVAEAHDDSTGRCSAALGVIDEMAVETIHAFARRLLQSNTAAVGLPPAFEVIDSAEAGQMWSRRWRDFVGSTLASDSALRPDVEHLLRCGLTLGLTIRQLRELSLAFESAWHRLTRVDVTRVDVIDLRPVSSAIDAVLALRATCLRDDDKLARHIDSVIVAMRDDVERLDDDLFTRIHGLADLPRARKGNGGKDANWAGRLSEVRVALAEIDRAVQDALADVRNYVLSGVANLLIDFTFEGVEQRRVSGKLAFHDLLVSARDLLRDDDRARTAASERFRHVLVDEFQDTDPLQSQIVRLLTGRGGATLFTVGDPRQSIYRFRGADVAQYTSMRSSSGASMIELRTNFRTSPSVLQWIEVVTGRLRGVSGHVEPAPLVGHRDFAGSVALIGDRHPKGLLAPTVREIEAADVVTTVKDLLGSSVLLGDGEPARHRDVAILIPTRALLPSLERALRRENVPYRIESRSLVWSTQELRDVVSILRAVDDPSDEVAVVASLRSAAFGVSDDELLAWRLAGGGWDYSRSSPAETTSPVAAAFEWLARLHELRWWTSVPDLVELVIDERSLFDLARARPRQRETWQRLRFVQDQVLQWHCSGGRGLGAFVDWAGLQIDHGSDVHESIIAEDDDDAVRIMTVHASKGLEFPIVVVAGLSSAKPNNGSGRALWVDDRRELRLGPKTLGWETAGFGEADAINTLEELDEGERLSYVALTRARDHLVVSVHRSHSSGDTLAERLASAADGVDLPNHREYSRTPSSTDVGEPGAESVTTFDRGQVIEHALRPSFTSATRLNRLVEGEPAPLPIEVDGYGTPQRLAFGRVVHRVLELVDLVDYHDLESMVRQAVSEEPIVVGRESEVTRSAELALSSPAVRQAASAEHCWRELYVVRQFGELTVEGLVDLCFDTEDGLVIVDYKTDVVTDAGPELIAEHYKWQLLTYAHLLGETLHRPVSRVCLLLISPRNQSAIEVCISGLEQKIGELKGQLSDLAGM